MCKVLQTESVSVWFVIGYPEVQTQDDLEDTEADVAETQAFLADLGKQCAAKKAAWGEMQAMRAEEISAISAAVKILNDDDACAGAEV